MTTTQIKKIPLTREPHFKGLDVRWDMDDINFP